MAKRYTSPNIWEDNDGGYVSEDDYETVRDERDGLREVIGEVVGKIQSVLRNAEKPSRGAIVVRRTDLTRWSVQLANSLEKKKKENQ